MYEISYIKGIRNYSFIFCIVFFTMYFIVPITFMRDSAYLASMGTLCLITSLVCIFYTVGLNLFKRLFIPHKYLYLKFSYFALGVFSLYLVCISLLFVTASEIPLISALQGASPAEMAILRSLFVKERHGWEALLVYFITILDTTILPFIIVESMRRKFRYRYLFIVVFFLYSISFLEKAYFFKLLIPLSAYYYLVSKNRKVLMVKMASILLILLLFMYSVTGISSNVENNDGGGYFFSQTYTPSGTMSAIAWRALSVPVFTAFDAITVFRSEFDGEYLMGSTSSILSKIFGMERSNFERVVYQYQFGGLETGNANQFFGAEAFVNFGYLGVIIFSFLIGRFVQMTLKSRNISYICILPTFIYNLFNAGLIGVLFSNGFIIFFMFFVPFVRFKES